MNTNSDKERNLIVNLINDSESAFVELYTLYKDRLIYFALRFVKSREFAEDVFQDAFTAVWQNRHFLNPDASFSSYLYTIMRNRILNLLANIDKELQLKEKILSSAIDVSNDTENRIIDAELTDLFEKALDYLTPQQRTIFELSRKEMLSHKEIANYLGISVYTVQQHISTSLKVIRTYLSKYAGLYTDILLFLFCLNR